MGKGLDPWEHDKQGNRDFEKAVAAVADQNGNVDEKTLKALIKAFGVTDMDKNPPSVNIE